VLRRAGVGVFSEESGVDLGTTDEVVVIDPIDGSTTPAVASRGLPHRCASSTPTVRLSQSSVNQAPKCGTRPNGGGAWCGERRLRPSGCTELSEAIVVVSAFSA